MAQVIFTTKGPLFENPKKKVAKATEEGLEAATTRVVDVYKRDTPVRTGFLRSQWIYKVNKNTSTIYNDANYAHHVFRRRATLDRNKRAAEERVANSISKSIEQALN